jgi:AcrR family transcriptional regulator
MASPDATRQRPGARREQEIVEATRRLFDERGLQDAPIEEIARAVGINRALIYRHFASKEELFVAAVTSYLAELDARVPEPDQDADPIELLRTASERYASFCLEYPAFLDCSLSLMRRPARELRAVVSNAVWLQLGQGMAACLSTLARILELGKERGLFEIEDPDFSANHLYTQVLGTMHLARIQVGVRELSPGVPGVFPIEPERVKQAAIDDAMALARIRAREPAGGA